MAVVHAPDSAFSKEMRKWEAQHTQYGPPGRPYTFQPYPMRLYKAERTRQGTCEITEAQTANDERERAYWESRGFVSGGQQAALEALSAQELEQAKLAAEINYEAQRMSEKAREEITAAQQAAGARHLPSIPETPVKRGGRKKPKPPHCEPEVQ